MEESNLHNALPDWKNFLGDKNVHFQKDSLANYLNTTLPRSHAPLAVLTPGSVEEIQFVLKIAVKHKIPVYPVSRGKNWGYGNACPAGPGQVVLDLSRMNKIIEVNEELAYAVIEPGVTQSDLEQYLSKNNINLWMDATGAGPDASVLGNTIERGFGHSPLADHFNTSCGYEVVLADGRIFNTGFGHYKNSQVTHIFKAGIGPSLDGLFTQSNLGIVTKIGIWLNPKPEKLMAYAFTIKDDATLLKVVEALRPLRMQGILPSALHIANDLRVISSHMTYPWGRAGGKIPLSKDLREKIVREMTLGSWNALGALYGDRHTTSAAKKSIKRALRGLAFPIFIDETLLKLGQIAVATLNLAGWGKGLDARIRSIEPVFDLLKGKPNKEHLKGVFWRTKRPLSSTDLDIDSDPAIGLMWLSPVIPMTKNGIKTFLSIVEPTFNQFGFDALITLTMLNARTLSSVLSINFDRTNPKECDQAQKCYDTLLTLFLDHGFIPYRAGTQTMGHLADQSQGYWEVVRDLKKALDPEGILAPNRYCPKLPNTK